MLGTNDTKERFHLTSYNIAQGIARLSQKAKTTPAASRGGFPKILVIAPPPIEKGYYETEVGPAMGRDCHLKSDEMPMYLKELLATQGTDFLDTKGIIPMNNIDFMHFDEEGHELLSKLVFHKIKSILS